MAQALRGLKLESHPSLLVGLEQSDDAGVFRLTDEIALVQTVDFFTPIVDEPFLFGQIAAANALSDVYAMGGKPLTAMNMACFPVKTLDMGILQETLSGGLDKIHEADAVLVGGHSIEDKEFKYGLSVTGVVHPDKVLTNRGARAGDKLILTKKLGTGIVATAIKADLAEPGSRDAIQNSMATLNRKAAEAMTGFGVHACTDVTGFGLLGHALEMVENSQTGLIFHASEVPVFDDLQKYCEMGLVPGGLHRNRTYREPLVRMGSSVPQHLQDALYDPQTSGGLLIAIGPDETPTLLERLHSLGVDAAAIVGEVVTGDAGRIVVI